MNKKTRGFTIIELIVVIAIIAVLASIVMVNVTQYINKSKDSAIKGNMATILTNAAIYYDDPTQFSGVGTNKGTYTGFELLSGYTGPKGAITSANVAPVINPASSLTSAFCVTAALKDGTTYCIDSTGYKGTLGASKCTGTIYTCI